MLSRLTKVIASTHVKHTNIRLNLKNFEVSSTALKHANQASSNLLRISREVVVRSFSTAKPEIDNTSNSPSNSEEPSKPDGKRKTSEKTKHQRKNLSRGSILVGLFIGILASNDITAPYLYKLLGLEYPPPRGVFNIGSLFSSALGSSEQSIISSNASEVTEGALEELIKEVTISEHKSSTHDESATLTPGKEHIEDPFCEHWNPSPWTWYEIIKTTLLWTVLPIAPIRLALIIPCVIGAWFFSKLSLIGLPKPTKENKFTMFKSRSTWRRRVLIPAMICAKLALFFAGFMWISTTGHLAPSKEVPIIVANHVTESDALIMYSKQFTAPGFISKTDVVDVPLLGPILIAMGALLLDRSSSNSRAEVQHEINRRTLFNQALCLAQKEDRPYELLYGGEKATVLDGRPTIYPIDINNQEAYEKSMKNYQDGISQIVYPTDKEFHHICVFPEGTTTSGLSIVDFKLGAFRPGVPVQPVVLSYPYYHFNPTYAGVDGLTCFFRIISQFYNRCEMKYLPPYYPSLEEQADPVLYASNIQRIMAEALNQPICHQAYY